MEAVGIIWGKRNNIQGGFLESFTSGCRTQFPPLSSGAHPSEIFSMNFSQHPLCVLIWMERYPETDLKVETYWIHSNYRVL